MRSMRCCRLWRPGRCLRAPERGTERPRHEEGLLALSQPRSVHEFGELALGQLVTRGGAQYTAHDPVMAAPALITGSAKTGAGLRLLGVPEFGVVRLAVARDGSEMVGG